MVDNSPLRGADVQTVSGGAVAGRLDSGDVIRLTYTDQVNLATLSAGWNGSALAVVVRVRDGNTLASAWATRATRSTCSAPPAAPSVPLGSVRLNEDYVKTNRTAQLNATMTATTVTVNGAPATQVTLTLGTLAGSGERGCGPSPPARRCSGRPARPPPTSRAAPARWPRPPRPAPSDREF